MFNSIPTPKKKKFRFNTRCSLCERPAWRRYGHHYSYGRQFICGSCLADMLFESATGLGLLLKGAR